LNKIKPELFGERILWMPSAGQADAAASALFVMYATVWLFFPPPEDVHPAVNIETDSSPHLLLLLVRKGRQQ